MNAPRITKAVGNSKYKVHEEPSKTEAILSFENSGTSYLTMQLHVPKDGDPT